MSQPIRRTLVETYLRNRGIKAVHDAGRAALPSALLLSAPDDALADRDLAGDDRRRHRSRRRHHRRASHLACAGRLSARRRSTRRDGPWAVSSAMPSALARPKTSSLPAKASRRCCRCAVRCPPCRWPPRSRPTTSPPFCSRRRLRRLYIARDADAAGDMALAALDRTRRSSGHRGARLVSADWATSTRTCKRIRRSTRVRVGAAHRSSRPQDAVSLRHARRRPGRGDRCAALRAPHSQGFQEGHQVLVLLP